MSPGGMCYATSVNQLLIFNGCKPLSQADFRIINDHVFRATLTIPTSPIINNNQDNAFMYVAGQNSITFEFTAYGTHTQYHINDFLKKYHQDMHDSCLFFVHGSNSIPNTIVYFNHVVFFYKKNNTFTIHNIYEDIGEGEKQFPSSYHPSTYSTMPIVSLEPNPQYFFVTVTIKCAPIQELVDIINNYECNINSEFNTFNASCISVDQNNNTVSLVDKNLSILNPKKLSKYITGNLYSVFNMIKLGVKKAVNYVSNKDIFPYELDTLHVPFDYNKITDPYALNELDIQNKPNNNIFKMFGTK
jgi:hypothetical protein